MGIMAFAASAFLLLLAIFQVRRYRAGNSYRILVLALIFSWFFLSEAYLIADYFTGNGINESVIYLLLTGCKGAGLGAYYALITIAVLSLATISGWLFFLNQRLKSPTQTKKSGQSYKVVILLIGALCLNPASKNIANRLYDRIQTRNSAQKELDDPNSFARLYKIPTPSKLKNQHPPNLVFVYLEGLERTYFDEKIFPGLIKNLRQLEKEALSFTNIRQLWCTDWTIAGMTASQLGIPLAITSDYNSMGGMDNFLPEAVGIGDILKQSGYQLEYWGGAASKFAGKGKFYHTHGFAVVKGREELRSKLQDQNYLNWWGLFDDSLFALTYKRFEELSTLQKPFALFMITLDTHHPEGLSSRSCKNIKYGDGRNQMLNVVAGADRLIADFVNKIRNSKYGSNTIICLASDHLARKNGAWNLLQQGRRRNLLMIFTPDGRVPQLIDRPGSTLDTGATLLQLMAPGEGKLGLGRDLLNPDSQTLVERFADPDSQLKKWRHQLIDLWNFPSIKNGITVEPELMRLRLGNHFAQLPILIELDQDLQTKQIKFSQNGSRSLAEHIVTMNPEQTFIWIDLGSVIKLIDSRFNTTEKGLSLFAGRAGAPEGLLIQNLDKITEVPFTQLVKAFSKPASATLAKLRYNRLWRKILTVDNLHQILLADSGLPSTLQENLTQFALRSCGGPTKKSSVWFRDPDMKCLVLERGISLIEFGLKKRLRRLAHYDLCTHLNSDDLKQQKSFARIIDDNRSPNKLFVLIVHDSPFCSPANLEPLFKNLPLKLWKELKFRQPYIGLIFPQGQGTEFLGKPESSIGVRFSTE